MPSQPRRRQPSPSRLLYGPGRWRSRTGAIFGVVGLAAALAVAALGGLAGCKDKAGKAAPDPAALRAQQALIARRDAMLASRKQTQEERKRLQEEMRKAAASGGDTVEMQQKLDELDSQLEVQNNQLADEFQALSTKLDSIAVATDQSAGVTAREADVGSREDRLAQREERMAAREARVAEREREAARACAAVPAVVMPAAAPARTTYSRKEIDGLLGRARSTMGKRGLVAGDLPEHAQGLEREATRAMADGDLGKAYLAAQQLTSIVDSVKIDGPFIKTKITRLQNRITAKGGKLDEATNKSMGAGIADVMQKWGDGDFGKANAKLNQLSNALN